MQTENQKHMRNDWLKWKKGQRKVLSEELLFAAKKTDRKLNM